MKKTTKRKTTRATRKRSKILLTSILLLTCLLAAPVISGGCVDEDERETVSEENDMNNYPTANMKILSQTGEELTVKIELYPDKAPKTVENFIRLANSGFYDGMHFHRIVPGGCLQGGGYKFIQTDSGLSIDESVGKVAPIEGEFASNGHPENDLRHTKGTISMARTSDPNSATSQFFLCVGDYPSWDGEYAAFGMAKDEESLLALGKLASSRYVFAGYAFQTLPYPLIKIVSVTVE